MMELNVEDIDQISKEDIPEEQPKDIPDDRFRVPPLKIKLRNEDEEPLHRVKKTKKKIVKYEESPTTCPSQGPRL